MNDTMKTLGSLALSAFFIVACGESAATKMEAAEPEAKQAETKPADGLEKVRAQVEKSLQEGKPGIKVEAVEESAISGLYKATVGPGQYVYITPDGKYFISGDVYEVKPGKIVNLSEYEKNGDRAKAMAGVKKEDMIVFSPEGEVKKAMYVFTDVDCGYCQLLHSKVPEYNELGIEVRYLAYPRAGLKSNSYNKIASAWCAEDRNDALTKLKKREEIPTNVCENNPVDDQYRVGREIGLTGTPAIILEDGELIAGYVEPARLKDMIGL